jgi:VWFA-related protein
VALLAGQQQPSFRSRVEVIVIDVNVVEKSHVPVEGLTTEDFIVSVDYKRRKVASAQFVRYDVRTATTTDRNTRPAAGGATPIDVPLAPSPARNVLIVIDEDSMEPGDGLLVQREAAKFIDRLAPDDRIGVVTIPRVQSEVTMTKIREQVKAALAKVITGSERYRSQMFRIGLWEAFAAEGDSFVLSGIQARECRGQDAVCRQEVAQEVRFLQTQEHWRGERSLRALRDLGLALEKVDGPKTMLLVSGGTPSPDLKSNTAYSLIGDAFAAAQVSLYTLYVEQPEFGQVKYRASPTAAQDHLVEREGIENATSAAGGTFMETIGTWDQYFDRIVTELSGSYLLGIEVEPTDRDGRPHQVSVKVDRRGVDVRARKRYVIQPDR